ncbi:MAG: hypothetical protein FWD60_03465 [Candidatus Azobacteroides sp.]|nr:hypothetical protein [Candidatus Azobacteroides sp.]
MKRTIILFFAVISAFSAYCQTYLEEGDRCFDDGDYTCATSKYDEAFKSASGKDKQIADIRLSRAKNCAEWLQTANQAFINKNYVAAKENYQKVFDSNPKDEYVKSQLEKCNTALNSPPKPTLRRATTAELTDIWNNRYGVLPERRQNLINVGIDPDDAQTRINKGEGKPITPPQQTPQQTSKQTVTTLAVSPQNITFNANGGRTIIEVGTNATDFNVTYLPYWCKVGTKYSDWFSLVCNANNGTSRNGYVTINSGGKEMQINISQSGIVATQTKTKSNTNTYSSSNNTNKSIYKSKKCFNCPTAKYSWGLSIGYVSKFIDYGLGEESINYFGFDDKMDGVQVGLRFEPLFKYGFGLNMGLSYEYYSKTFNYTEYDEGYYYDNYDMSYKYEEHVLNIPFHLEYRFNFSKYFNIFAYGGIGLDIITDSSFGDFTTNTLFEYGGGLRIDHVQFNVGKSNLLNSSNGSQGFPGNKYKDWILSMSYMF